MNLLLLAISFILTGISMISMRALGAMGLTGFASIYTVGFYSMGVVFSLITWAVTRHRICKRDAIVGAAMGVCGVCAILSLLAALTTVSGVVAFPVRGAGNIVLTAALGCLVWKEDIAPRQWLGIVCAAAAIALLL